MLRILFKVGYLKVSILNPIRIVLQNIFEEIFMYKTNNQLVIYTNENISQIEPAHALVVIQAG